MDARKGSYTPIFDLLETPDLALGELCIRERHPDGAPIPEDELESMAKRLAGSLSVYETWVTFQDVIRDEERITKETKGE